MTPNDWCLVYCEGGEWKRSHPMPRELAVSLCSLGKEKGQRCMIERHSMSVAIGLPSAERAS